MASPPPITKPLSELPLHFALVLFPDFQALDVFGPLDALNTMKRLYPHIPLRLSILSSTLSPVSTFSSPPSSSSTNDNPPFEQKILPTHTFHSPPPSSPNPNSNSNSTSNSNSDSPIHVLLIPGGLGTRLSSKLTWTPAVDYLSAFFSQEDNVRNLKAVFTVCTGSMVLARTRIRSDGVGDVGGGGGGEGGEGEFKGILDGIKATTNKRNLHLALSEFPTVHWQPRARWVQTTLPIPLNNSPSPSHFHSTTSTSHSVKLWTTSGVSAGIDGIFSLISDSYGPPVADYISQVLEYERTTDPTIDPFAAPA